MGKEGWEDEDGKGKGARRAGQSGRKAYPG